MNGPLLKPGQSDDYGLPTAGASRGPCMSTASARLSHTHRLGAHGLPLMGHGDWNDGMNRIGSRGKGESVWLAWFSITCRLRFAAIASERGEADQAAELHEQAEALPGH